MHDFDLIIRNGEVVTPSAVIHADLGIAEGVIQQIQPSISSSAKVDRDASGLHIFPGAIDSHVHFNDPGRTDWEGLWTGSRALAAGGGTLFFDMPLNAHPPTVGAESFDLKLAAARNRSITDFAFWGGLVPGNVDQMASLDRRGVVGFKAFMTNSGIDDFPCVDDKTLRAGMRRAAELGTIVAVHAESETLTAKLTAEKLRNGTTSVRDFLDSRPIEAELDAIQRALDLAGETGCRLHIVHVSCGAGVEAIAAAKKKGVDVSCETCPHYLALTGKDMIRIGAMAKCAPPLRSAAAQESLWQSLAAGFIDTIGSDHSPAPPAMKTDPNFFKVWGGISGVQHALPILLSEGHARRNLSLPLLGRLMSYNVAERFRLPNGIGQATEGADASLALVDLRTSYQVDSAALFYRHQQSPFAGRSLTGKVVETILRGQTIYKDGTITSRPAGRLVTPRTA